MLGPVQQGLGPWHCPAPARPVHAWGREQGDGVGRWLAQGTMGGRRGSSLLLHISQARGGMGVGGCASHICAGVETGYTLFAQVCAYCLCWGPGAPRCPARRGIASSQPQLGEEAQKSPVLVLLAPGSCRKPGGECAGIGGRQRATLSWCCSAPGSWGEPRPGHHQDQGISLSPVVPWFWDQQEENFLLVSINT